MGQTLTLLHKVVPYDVRSVSLGSSWRDSVVLEGMLGHATDDQSMDNDRRRSL